MRFNPETTFAEEADDGIADAGKAEVGRIDLADRNPEGLSGIISSTDSGLERVRIAMNRNEVIHVEGMNSHATIQVDVRRGEEILDVVDVEACLFLDLTSHALFYRLAHIDKPSRQVECTLSRLLAAAHDEHLTDIVDDEGRCG